MSISFGKYALPAPEDDPTACDICRILNDVGSDVTYEKRGLFRKKPITRKREPVCSEFVGTGGTACIDSDRTGIMLRYFSFVQAYRAANGVHSPNQL